MVRLKYLNVAWNQLKNVDDEISVLQENAVNLTMLDLRHNPWQKVLTSHFCYLLTASNCCEVIWADYKTNSLFIEWFVSVYML